MAKAVKIAHDEQRYLTSDKSINAIAKYLYNAGYRKASEVAREIFEEIEGNLNNLVAYYKEKRKYVTEIEYSEFEQRYCDIKIRTFEERLLKMSKLKKKYMEEK